MDKKTIKNKLIYKEFDAEKSNDWFSFTRSKFISHVDTFYYSVLTVGEWSESLGARTLIQTLKSLKEKAEREKLEMPFMEDDVFGDLKVKPYFGFGMYRYSITKEDCFDIFIAEAVPNNKTNAIVVQLRSQFIWLNGLENAFYESLVYIYGVLDKYDIKFSNITENRIDYAYHTNYIQDMLSFFKDENLGKMQVSSYKRWSKEGNFFADEIHNDYISLGRRKSNSSFVRIYNKSKEVIELGYKQFFVPIWLECGLISKFDKYIFDIIFEDGKKSWNYKEYARCRFYLEYGEDEETKINIRQLMQYEDSDIKDYKKIADACVPDLINIVNLEIQTQRKFYREFVFPKIDYPEKLPIFEKRMYLVLNMLSLVKKFITEDTIRFVKFKGKYSDMRRDRRPNADWWDRLSTCNELNGINYSLAKEYQHKHDLNRSKNSTISNIANLATLFEYYSNLNSDDFSISEDFINILSCLNDNDLAKYSNLRIKKINELKIKFD